jgi:ABC-type glutathione transport system ATPase component
VLLAAVVDDFSHEGFILPPRLCGENYFPSHFSILEKTGHTGLPQIAAEHLSKTFHIARRDPGLWGSVKGVMKRDWREVRALDGVSLSIEKGEIVGDIAARGKPRP